MPDNKTEIFKEIFIDIKDILSGFVPPFEVRGETKDKYNLYGRKKVVIFGKERDGIYFASVIINKGFTGFHFFPIYSNPKMIAEIPDDLKKCLKGKSCFQIKKKDEALYKSIKKMLKKGVEAYKKMGWI